MLADTKDKNSLKFDDEEKANILQTQISSVYSKEPDGDIPRIPSRTDSLNSTLNITEVMVKKELLNLNVYKSIGPDGLHPRLLKELAALLAEPIALVFNKTITDGILPQNCRFQ